MNKTLQQVGIWVDTQQAHIVRLTEEAATMETLTSGIEGLVREPGEGRPEGRFGNQFIDPEKTIQRKHEQAINQFVEDILAKLSGEEELVIFGPAQMKHKLAKAIREHRQFSDHLLDVVTSDKMTDNQTIAWVRDFFGNMP
jgi:hypothetical protein